MLKEQGSSMVIPTQVAHDLGDRQCGKGSMGLQTDGHQRGEYFDQQSGVQAMPLSWPCTNREDRFEDLPETFHQMMLCPNVPDFRTSHGFLTKVHQIITASCALLKKEKNNRTTGWTMRANATRRYVNTPCGIMQNESFLPLGGLLLFPIDGKGLMAFACNTDCGKPSIMQPLSERLRDKP